MKFYFTLFILINFSLQGQSKHNEITFTILNKFVKDNGIVDLEIKNHSSKKYFLPIIQNDLSDKLRFEFETYLFLKTDILDKNGKPFNWYNENILKDCDELSKYWEDKKMNLSINDFVLLKPNESLKLKVPFHSIIKVCGYNKWSIINLRFDKNKFIQISYLSPDILALNHFLSKKNRDEIVKEGFNLYEKAIISNKVFFLTE